MHRERGKCLSGGPLEELAHDATARRVLRFAREVHEIAPAAFLREGARRGRAIGRGFAEVHDFGTRRALVEIDVGVEDVAGRSARHENGATLIAVFDVSDPLPSRRNGRDGEA